MKKLLSLVSLLAINATFYHVNAQLTDQDLQVGDTVEFEGKKWLLGVNLVANSNFNNMSDEGEITGWTVGKYNQMTTATYNWHKDGGYDGGAYIQSKSGGGAASDNSIAQRWQIDTNSKYYMSFWLKNNTEKNQYVPVISLTSILSTEGGQNEKERTLLGMPGSPDTSTSFGYANCKDGGKSWAQTSFFFNSEEYIYLQYNARWTGNTCFDGFYLAKLYDPEVTSAIDLVKIQVQATASSAMEYADMNLAEYPGLSAPIYDLVMLYGEDFEPADVEEAKEAIKSMQDALETAKNAMKTASELNEYIKVVEILSGKQEIFPGIDNLQSVYDEICNNMSPDWAASEYTEAVAEISKAIEEYYYSQDFSMESPANYSFLIKNPQFLKLADEGTFSEDGSVIYPKGADYKNGNNPTSAGATYEGWIKDSSTGGGDQRLNFSQSRICWNAWATDFDYLGIKQELTEIPNGYYTVSADVVTEQGNVTTQHVYGSTSLGKTESPYLKEGESTYVSEEPFNGTWKTLETEKIIVSDNKLTIGFTSTGDRENSAADLGIGQTTDHRRGWFLVSNFRLKYYGPLSDGDLKKAFDEKISMYQAQCDTMLFSGDQNAFQDSINKYKSANSAEEINNALNALEEAHKNAEKSIAKQVEIMNGITASIADSINGGAYSGDIKNIAEKMHSCMIDQIESDKATYSEMDSIAKVLYTFRDDYAPALRTAMDFHVNDATAKEILEKNIENQTKALTNATELPSNDLLVKYISDLNKAMKECEAIDLYKSGAKDYTSLIVNPTIDNNDKKAIPQGWNIQNTGTGDGRYTNAGQQVDDNKSGHYLDAWAESGRLRYNAHQTIENLPNGKFELKAMVRTTSDNGTYLYAIADNDSSTTVLEPIMMERINITELGGPQNSEGGDSIIIDSDAYGSIFVDLYKRTDGGSNATEEQGDTLNANGGKGRGWFYKSLEIEVKNHTLTIGFTTDSVFTMKYGGVPFEGSWVSADNFSLRMLEEGDNSNWNPTTSIDGIEKEEIDKIMFSVVNRTIKTNGDIYSLNGTRISKDSQVPAGVYIIRLGEKAKKIIVK